MTDSKDTASTCQSSPNPACYAARLNGRSPYEFSMDHFAIVTAFGQDRPGIVAPWPTAFTNSAATSKTAV